jgi:large exoprotein involved in heme utilization and adhesion
MVTVAATGALTIENGGEISSDTNGSGNGGDVNVKAASLSLAAGTGQQATGISADTYGAGNAGTVTVTTAALAIDGGIANQYGAGISSETEGTAGNASVDSTGSAGNVVITVHGPLTMINGANIDADSYGLGNAGNVTVAAGSLSLNSANQSFPTFISSDAVGSTGLAGKVTVTTMGALSIANGGEISTDTFSSGNGGDVLVTAGSIVINGGTSPVVTAIESSSELGATGSAGKVTVTTGALTIVNTGEISSATFGSGNGGDVTVTAGSISINGDTNKSLTGITAETNSGSTGSAGKVTVTATGALTIENGGEITADTNSSGSAGAVTVTAGGNIDIISGGINALTESSGAAGSVFIKTRGTLTIGGPGTSTTPIAGGGTAAEVASRATDQSAGQPGSITISAANLVIGSGGSVNVGNNGTVPDLTMFNPTQIMISVQNLKMIGGEITAASTVNADASSIDIYYSQSMRATDAKITTTAEYGNGGLISIDGSGNLGLDASQITSSVAGTIGNGGDVHISAPTIVMNTAAIQANTTAKHASGGTVNIDAGAILPSFQSITLGGTLKRFDSSIPGFNLIQAAAPDGVSGALNVTTPTLDIGSALLALTGRAAAPIPLGRNPCDFSQGSSLSVAGRGGLPDSAYDPLWVEPEHSGQIAAEIEYRSRSDFWRPLSVSARIPPCRW